MYTSFLDTPPPRRHRHMQALGADFCVTQRACSTPGQTVVEAWLVVHAPGEATRCLVVAEGFDDAFHFGNRTIRSIFSPASPGQWQAAKDGWRWAVSAWRGPEDGASAAVSWMEQRFAGIRVRANSLPAGASP